MPKPTGFSSSKRDFLVKAGIGGAGTMLGLAAGRAIDLATKNSAPVDSILSTPTPTEQPECRAEIVGRLRLEQWTDDIRRILKILDSPLNEEKNYLDAKALLNYAHPLFMSEHTIAKEIFGTEYSYTVYVLGKPVVSADPNAPIRTHLIELNLMSGGTTPNKAGLRIRRTENPLDEDEVKALLQQLDVDKSDAVPPRTDQLNFQLGYSYSYKYGDQGEITYLSDEEEAELIRKLWDDLLEGSPIPGIQKKEEFRA